MNNKKRPFISALCSLSILALCFFAVPSAQSENLTSHIHSVHQNMIAAAKKDPATASLYAELGYPLARLEALKVTPLTDAQVCGVVKEAAQDIKSARSDVQQDKAATNLTANLGTVSLVILAGMLADNLLGERHRVKKQKVTHFLGQNIQQQGSVQTVVDSASKVGHGEDPEVQRYKKARREELDPCQTHLLKAETEFQASIDYWNRILPTLKKYRRIGAFIALPLSVIYINCENLQICSPEEAKRIADEKVLKVVNQRIIKRIKDKGVKFENTVQFLVALGEEMRPQSSRFSEVPVNRYGTFPELLLEDVDDERVSLGEACSYAIAFPKLRTKFELYNLLREEEFKRGLK